ncbi:calcium-binding protein [Actinorhabdospora filicis]|uniref:Calcium-binding protein n=1 Tax=Actinorhabdospora filicis TaxID=1785913 RepID=A0A9W6W8V2_9ACTN|nr:EF-hand domain-containing protein [Actinorhabdospora filicis]GLZ77944.1 calcium-binding protein [Actinorhabdospora filicis]
MASELQRRKIGVVFTGMDADGDGFLEESDFRALAARWSAVRVAGDPERLAAIMLGWWATLLAASDVNRDGKVTVDEVLTVVDRLPGMREAVTATADAMFEAVDENADDLVSPGEYGRMIEAWSGKAPGPEVFARLDTDGDGSLSRAEFADLWFEFWAGDDADAPGTQIFGPLAA